MMASVTTSGDGLACETQEFKRYHAFVSNIGIGVSFMCESANVKERRVQCVRVWCVKESVVCESGVCGV